MIPFVLPGLFFAFVFYKLFVIYVPFGHQAFVARLAQQPYLLQAGYHVVSPLTSVRPVTWSFDGRTPTQRRLLSTVITLDPKALQVACNNGVVNVDVIAYCELVNAVDAFRGPDPMYQAALRLQSALATVAGRHSWEHLDQHQNEFLLDVKQALTQEANAAVRITGVQIERVDVPPVLRERLNKTVEIELQSRAAQQKARDEAARYAFLKEQGVDVTTVLHDQSFEETLRRLRLVVPQLVAPSLYSAQGACASAVADAPASATVGSCKSRK